MALGPLPGPLYLSLTLPHRMTCPHFPYYLQFAVELTLQNFLKNLVAGQLQAEYIVESLGLNSGAGPFNIEITA